MNQSETKRWRTHTAKLILAIWLIAGTGAFVAPHVAASPVRAEASASASVPVHESNAEVLPETSIDGPGFSSLSDYVPNPQTYPPGAFLATAIAWTGTDPGHSLNVIVSQDGFEYSKNKVTLQDNSDSHPAVLLFANTTSGTLGPNLVVLAWTGTDSNHSLNVMFDVYGVRQKITLSDNSAFSPALAYFKGQVWLAWTGTDSGQSLNVMPMGSHGVTPGHKTTLRGTGFSSRGGPSLRADARDNQLLLSWTQTAAPSYIDLAQSSDGVAWATSFSPPPPQTSGSGPDVLAVSDTIPVGLPTDYWAWTGTDSLNSLNIAYTSTLSNWPTAIVTLNEQGLGSPALGYSNKLGPGQPNTVRILLAWTGTDTAHHLNVAIIQVG
jgi:hypothetical protein